MRQIIVICGPTASGKSQLALQLAGKLNAAIINADAMQVYRQLPIITASPKAGDLCQAEHYLYNHLDITQSYSVAQYVAQVLEVIEKLPLEQKIILVGGTGLYINSLIYGMHKIPDIDDALRSSIRSQVLEQGLSSVYTKLEQLDQVSAHKLHSGDTKRICRALEVVMQTGRSIDSFYTAENLYQPLLGCDIKTFFINPPRQEIYQACDERFTALINNGAIDEAAKILSLWPNLQTPATKALGLSQLISYLQGQISLSSAISLAQQATRQFAKRQITWFGHQLHEPYVVNFSDQNSCFAAICNTLN
jgi:tRNA dimethylallyltransferase